MKTRGLRQSHQLTPEKDRLINLNMDKAKHTFMQNNIKMINIYQPFQVYLSFL